MCSVLCWEGTAPAQAVPSHHCGKSRQPRKATCTRKEVVTRYKQSFLHKLSFETHSSDLNLAAAALIPGTTVLVAQYQSSYITGSAISTSPSIPLHGLDLEAFPTQRVRVLNVEGQCCMCICHLVGVLRQELLRAWVSQLAHVPAQGSNALASPVCYGPKTGAVQWGLTSGNLGFPQDCWFSILQAGSTWSAVKGRMASFPSTAVVLLDAHEISTSPLPFLFPRSSLNRNFSFFGETEVNMKTNETTQRTTVTTK